jgi:GDSL-like lipase/acylhydrolase family protein
MEYWLVMAIVAMAVVAVLFAIGSADELSAPARRGTGSRPVWVALGTSGNTAAETGGPSPSSWVDLVRASLGDFAIAYDFTRPGCTAEEAQRDQLAAAAAVAPDVVSILLGPDDFRDAEDLGAFERRLWHILTTLRDAGSIAVLAGLSDLRTLPSLAEEDDHTLLAEELQSWNVALARLVAAADGELVDWRETTDGTAADLFTEHGSRFILTDAGQRWFASLMERPVKRLLGVVVEPDPSETATDPAAASSSDAR